MEQADDNQAAANNICPLSVFIGKHNEDKLKEMNVKCMFI
jgi:hypothetical protein